jgi:hypothetical protein
MGSKLGLEGDTQEFLSAVYSSQPLHAANIWKQARSGPLHGHAEGQERDRKRKFAEDLPTYPQVTFGAGTYHLLHRSRPPWPKPISPLFSL